jgi:hypothetical protein
MSNDDTVAAIQPVTFEEIAEVAGGRDAESAELAAPTNESAVDACPVRTVVIAAGSIDGAPQREIAQCGKIADALGGSHAIERTVCRACCAIGPADESANTYLASLIAKVAYIIVVPAPAADDGALTTEIDASQKQTAGGRQTLDGGAPGEDSSVTDDMRVAAVKYIAGLHGRDVAERMAMTAALAGAMSEDDAVNLIDAALPEDPASGS